jgi:hypothetical protein
MMRQLLAEAAHGEEGVIYTETQAKHGGDGEDEDGHIVDACEEVQSGESDDNARASDQDRNARSHEATEGDDQDRERKRKRVLFSFPNVLVACLRDVEVYGRGPGDVGFELPGADLLSHLVHEPLCLFRRHIGADERIAPLATIRDEPRIFRLGVADHVAHRIHFADLVEGSVLGLLKLRAPGGKAVALEYYGEGRRRDAELLEHDVLNPLGLGLRTVVTATLQAVREVGGEKSAADEECPPDERYEPAIAVDHTTQSIKGSQRLSRTFLNRSTSNRLWYPKRKSARVASITEYV